MGSDWIMDRQALTATTVIRRMFDIASADSGGFRIFGVGESPRLHAIE